MVKGPPSLNGQQKEFINQFSYLNLHKNAACNPEQVLAATPHKTPTVRPPAPYHENYSS